MHKIGSDTIIASSTELKRSSRDGLRESALFKDFAIDGADGYTAAEASLSTGETIERVFTYSAHYPFYSDAVRGQERRRRRRRKALHLLAASCERRGRLCRKRREVQPGRCRE